MACEPEYHGFGLNSSLKLPCRIRSVGTACVCVSVLRSRIQSSPTKKKNFSRNLSGSPGAQIGPPMVPPKLLYRNGVVKLVVVLRLRDQALAFKSELRKYS